MSLKQIAQDLLGDQVQLGPSRRSILWQYIEEDLKDGLHCHSCSGPCCTFMHNSMQITPIEALEILLWLEEHSDLDDALSRCEETVETYRLESHYLGKERGFLRKTYTCPFFLNQAKGCSLSPHWKPLGCLAFQPQSPDQVEGGNCKTRSLPLEKQEQLNSQTQFVWPKEGFAWIKAPIPVALLEVKRALDKT